MMFQEPKPTEADHNALENRVSELERILEAITNPVEPEKPPPKPRKK